MKLIHGLTPIKQNATKNNRNKYAPNNCWENDKRESTSDRDDSNKYSKNCKKAKKRMFEKNEAMKEEMNMFTHVKYLEILLL